MLSMIMLKYNNMQMPEKRVSPLFVVPDDHHNADSAGLTLSRSDAG